MRENMENGLHLFANMKAKRQDRIAGMIQIAATEFLFLGSLLSLASMFGIHFQYAIVLPLGMLFAALIGVFWEKKGLVYGLLFFVTGFFVIGFLVQSKFAVNGLLAAYNQAVEAIGMKTGAYHPKYELTISESDIPLYTSFFMVFFALFLAAFCAMIVNGRQGLFLMLLLIPILLVMICFGVTPNIGSAMLLFIGMFLSWGLMGLPQGKQELFLCGIGMLVAVLLLSSLLALIFKGVHSDDTHLFDKALYAFRYGYHASKAYPNGNLEALGARNVSDDTALVVTMERPQQMYLRGFTGVSFDGNTFTEGEASVLYEHYSLFHWMHEDGFYADAIPAAVEQLIGEDTESAVTVQVRHADRRYLYTPYELVGMQERADLQNTNDTALISDRFFGSKEYEYQISDVVYNRQKVLKEALLTAKQQQADRLQQFLLTESNYQQYVYEQFTKIKEDQKKLVLHELGLTGDARAGYEDAYQLIYEYLQKNFTYNEKAEYEGDLNFFSDLFYEKEGYDVHYATAAVLMYRALGIPARYVEGYVIPQEMVRSLYPGEELQVTGQQAHAWVEIYRDGIGWYPVEFLQQYIDAMEFDLTALSASITGQEGVQTQDKDANSGTENPDGTDADSFQNSGDKTDDSENAGADSDLAQTEQNTPEREKTSGKTGHISGLTVFGIIWILFLAALIGTFLLRRVYYQRRRRTAFASENTNQAVRSMFAYLHELAGYAGTEEEMLVDEELMRLGERAAFSPHPLSKEDVQTVEAAVRSVREQILAAEGIRGKFAFIWWDCL